MGYEDYEPRSRTLSVASVVAAAAVLAAVGVALAAFATVRAQNGAIGVLEADVRVLEGRLEQFRVRDEALESRLRAAERKLNVKDAGIAPLAARVLRSVFTIETSRGLGAGFAGWVDGERRLHVVTAAHVVHYVGENVTIERDNGSWSAEVVGRERPEHEVGRDIARRIR